MTFDFKNASRQDLQKEYNRIAKEFGDDQFFTKKELHHLPEVLFSGEQVLAFSSGLMEGHTWLIALTDQRVLFLNKGLIYGLKQTSIDLDKINSITGETGLFFGKIKIEDSARQREIDNVWKRTVVLFTNRVREATEAKKHRGMPSQTNSDDVVSKLERLIVLKEKGILSEEEFKAQKGKILA